MIDRSILLYGTAEPRPKSIQLAAGPVTATFEDGQLRWIRFGGVEVIRAIAFLVRDRNWSTANPEISNLALDQMPDSFTLEFDARCPTIDGDFVWHGSFRGQSDGTLTCLGQGHPKQDFVTGRTGFVILHPLPGTVGRTMTIEHTDGSREDTIVPAEIVPNQVFMNVRALTHSPCPGVAATIRMEGDTWETEDHRNWTDASLKTYCRPLSLPWPYEIKKGQTVSQSVKLSFSGPSHAQVKTSKAVLLELGSARRPMPEIGLSVLPEDAEHATEVAALIKRAAIPCLNCRIDLRTSSWPNTLPHYRKLLDRTEARMTLEIILAGAAAPMDELILVARAAESEGIVPSAVIATPAADLQSYPPGTPFPEGVPSFVDLAAAARSAFPAARIGGGMLSNFTELNRKRPPRGVFDFVSHATSALVHAADDRSVMETIESVAHILRSTQAIIGGQPYRIGPSHIGNSFNPYGTSVTPNPDNCRVTMARMDPRQRGLFGAAWHLGYLTQAVDAGIEGITMASPVGEFGIVYRPLPHRQQWYDEAKSALVYPVYHVMAGVASAVGKPGVQVTSAAPDRVRAIAWKADGKLHVWLANQTDQSVDVEVRGLAAAGVSMLDETTFEAAASDPGFMNAGSPRARDTLSLSAYAVGRLILEDHSCER